MLWHILFTNVQMGTVVETGSYFIDQLQSTDPTVVSVTCKNASCSKILFMALKGGKATVSYRQMGSNGKGDCYSYHSIEYTVTKADPIAQFEVDGKATTEPAYMSLNDRNESFVVGFYMPTPEDHDGTIYTLHKKVPMSEPESITSSVTKATTMCISAASMAERCVA